MPAANPPTPPPSAARYTLRWTCPRCQRPWIAAAGVADGDRPEARQALSEQHDLTCGRCGAAWEPWAVGIDWQPENEPARRQVDSPLPAP